MEERLLSAHRDGGGAVSSAMPLTKRWPARTTVCLSLAALVFASRLWLIHHAAAPVPMWDQWDFEAANLYRPWLNGTLTWRDLLAPHNEHRMVLTRLVDLAILVATGEWNLWLQLLVNATLDAVCAAVVVATFWPALPRRAAVGLAVAVTLIWIAPLDCMSATHGHDSAFYFARLLPTLGFAAFATTQSLSLRWWGGCVAAVLALGSVASGVLAAAAIVGALTFIALLRGWRAQDWFTLAAGLAILVVGALLHAPTAGHAGAKASSLMLFLRVLGRCLAWPHINYWFASLLLQFPLVWLVIETRRRREPIDAGLRFALMLAAFALLNAAAIAYARGAAAPGIQPLPRYYGPFMLCLVAQFFAVARIAARHGTAGRLALLGWTGIAALGIGERSTVGFTEHLPAMRVLHRVSFEVARDFLVTGDRAKFNAEAQYPVLYPGPDVPARMLSDPLLRPILPIALRVGAEDPRAAPPWLVTHGRALTLVLLTWFAAVVFLAARPRPGES